MPSTRALDLPRATVCPTPASWHCTQPGRGGGGRAPRPSQGHQPGVPARRRRAPNSLLVQPGTTSRNTPARSMPTEEVQTLGEGGLSPEPPSTRVPLWGERRTGAGAVCRQRNRPEPPPGSPPGSEVRREEASASDRHPGHPGGREGGGHPSPPFRGDN